MLEKLSYVWKDAQEVAKYYYGQRNFKREWKKWDVTEAVKLYAKMYEEANNDNCETLINERRKEKNKKDERIAKARIDSAKARLKGEIEDLKNENEKGGFGGRKADRMAEQIIARNRSEKSEERRRFVQEHYPDVLLTVPEECREFVLRNSDHGGAERVLEVAGGGNDTFRLAWECARQNAIVTVVALYDQPQTLPLPDMYGKNLTFKTGGVDGCDCEEVLRLIKAGKIDTTPLITHRFPLREIEEAYRLFENRIDGVVKVAIITDKGL